METKCDTEKSPEHSSGNDYSPSIDVQVIGCLLYF